MQVEVGTRLASARPLDLFKQETRNSLQTLLMGKAVQMEALYHLRIRPGVQVVMVCPDQMRQRDTLCRQTDR